MQIMRCRTSNTSFKSLKLMFYYDDGLSQGIEMLDLGLTPGLEMIYSGLTPGLEMIYLDQTPG